MVPEKERRTLSTLSKICSDTPRGGYWLYMTVRNMRQFWPPFRSLENWYSLTPVCEEKYGNVILRPPYSSKFGEMFSFYSPFRPFVAFWINGRGWARVWASPSETHQSAPHPGQTRQQTNWDFKICLLWRSEWELWYKWWDFTINSLFPDYIVGL